MRREIVRIITPGTIMEGKMIDEKANHYLLCLTEHEGMYALAACDLSTGEVTATSAPAGQSWLMDELNVYAPTEILGAERVLDEARPVTRAWSKPVLFTPWTKRDEALAQRQFGEAAWMRLEPERRQALALLMSYLAETQKRSLSPADPGADVRAGSISGPRSVHAPQSGADGDGARAGEEGLAPLAARSDADVDGRPAAAPLD